MSLPADTCLELEVDIQSFLNLAVDLPGGMTLRAQLEPGEFPSLSGIVGKLLMPLNSALTPLAPFFTLLEVALAIVDFCKAIPASLGPPPNPSKLVKALSKLVKASAKLASLVPQLSIPIMIVGICKVIVATLSALVFEIEFQIDAATKLDLARDRVNLLAADPDLLVGAAQLQISIDCAQADLDLQASLGSSSLGPINKFLDLLNAFAGLAGLPPFGKVDVSGNAAAALQPLKDAIAAIDAVCGSIPT